MENDNKIINMGTNSDGEKKNDKKKETVPPIFCPELSTTMLVPAGASLSPNAPEVAVKTFYIKCIKEKCKHYKKETDGCKLEHS